MKLCGRYEEMLTKTGTIYYKAPEMFDCGVILRKPTAGLSEYLFMKLFLEVPLCLWLSGLDNR